MRRIFITSKNAFGIICFDKWTNEILNEKQNHIYSKVKSVCWKVKTVVKHDVAIKKM